MCNKILTEKKFNCQVCHRSYSYKYNLIQHKKVPDESKLFKCDVCLKVFSNQKDFNKHYRIIHTWEKPFTCQVCNKKFSRKNHLVQHQATHSEVRSFKCSICPEGRYLKT